MLSSQISKQYFAKTPNSDFFFCCTIAVVHYSVTTCALRGVSLKHLLILTVEYLTTSWSGNEKLTEQLGEVVRLK